jgi:ABC-type arginine transport system permease subunit
VRLLPKVLWFLLAFFALSNALQALRYLLPHVPFPAEIDNFTQRRIALSLHALGGAIALLAGPLQFVSRASGRATGIVIASWDGSIAAPSCWAGALPSGSRRMRRPDGSLHWDFSLWAPLGLLRPG